MKKSIFVVMIIATVGMISFTSCSEEAKVEHGETAAQKEYYCPMKCEGDKMYAEQEGCPVCGMDLVKD